MGTTGELIRLMNYVEDITTTLRRISAFVPTLEAEERKRLVRILARSRRQPERRNRPTGQKVVVAEIKTIAVIGAGTMGRGIAHVAALGGYRTILEDLLPNALRRAESEIRNNLDKAVELGKVSSDDAHAAVGRLEYAGSVEGAAREADLVIEAVPEELESKIEIFYCRLVPP